ncbi:MAG: hypothetical protein KIS66_06540 [Fimbriimonadaceae bacterium]|nr:hypothetical protein [Fimbriimonadaceae bacterium]
MSTSNLRANVLRRGAALLAVALASSLALARDDTSVRLLREALESAYRINARKIVVFNSDRYEFGSMSVSVLQSRGGEVLTTVVQPLSMQGFKTVDDGKTLKSYCPDQKKVWLQESPRVHQPTAEYRLAIAERNYRISHRDVDERVSGRSVTLVTADPRAPEMPTRRYYLDRDSRTLLRLETVDDKGRATNLMDTRAIEFLTTVQRSQFNALPTNIKPEPMETPLRTTSGKAGLEVNFRPILPARLPLGFEIEGVDVLREKGANLVALRITDGLATATVYLWDPREDVNVLQTPGMRERTVNGMKVRVIGDLPLVAKDRLLQGFGSKTMSEVLDRELARAAETLASTYERKAARIDEIERRIEVRMGVAIESEYRRDLERRQAKTRIGNEP